MTNNVDKSLTVPNGALGVLRELEYRKGTSSGGPSDTSCTGNHCYRREFNGRIDHSYNCSWRVLEAALTAAPATTEPDMVITDGNEYEAYLERQVELATEPVCDGGKDMWTHSPRERCTICPQFQPAESDPS